MSSYGEARFATAVISAPRQLGTFECGNLEQGSVVALTPLVGTAGIVQLACIGIHYQRVLIHRVGVFRTVLQSKLFSTVALAKLPCVGVACRRFGYRYKCMANYCNSLDETGCRAGHHHILVLGGGVCLTVCIGYAFYRQRGIAVQNKRDFSAFGHARKG